MKNTRTHFLMLALGIALSLASTTQAQWLIHTPAPGPTPLPGATTAMFPYQVGAYAGTVNVTTNPISSGIVAGTIGIAPNPFTNLTTDFFSNGYTTNPGGTFDQLNVASNDTADIYRVTFNFSGLALGYLPAGSCIAFLDVDINENVSELKAKDSSGNLIGTAWLGSPSPVFDYNAPTDSFNPGDEASISLTGGTYNINGKPGPTNPTSLFQGFTITQDIRSFTFIYDHTQTPPANGAGGYAIAISQQIPEPGTTTLAIVGAIGCLIASRRKHGFIRES